MRNLELKVRCPSEAALDAFMAQARAAGAVYIRTMGQRDVYFRVPRGRLKLREWWREDARDAERSVKRLSTSIGGSTLPAVGAGDGVRDDADVGQRGAELIAYARPDDVGSRFSDYLVSPVTEPATLRAVLAQVLGESAVVEKRRALYRYGRTRLHFDRVAALGAFVELETVMGEAVDVDTEAAAMAEHKEVIDLLGLHALPIVAGSYGELLEGRDRG